ncbi:hypothetical protein ACGFZR_15545 [Streptomyces sp. NPDC048241]|uniref:hypothetical protein n=1 Tax=Streptomyces sp. NPDC048241 TaxID=3365521 RepID=UPI003715895D
MTTPDRERLAALVQQRRTELRLGVEPAAKTARVSKDTWKRVEAGLKVQDRTYGAVDQALQWAPGSCIRTLDGGEPVPAEPIGGGSKATDVPRADLELAVGDAVRSAVIATKGSLTAEEILDLNDRVLDELRKRGIL